MGFFDWALSSPKQDPKVLAKKKGLTPEGESFMAERAPDDFAPPEQQDDQGFQAQETAGKAMPPAEHPTSSRMDQLAREISKLAAEIQYGNSGALEKQEGVQGAYDSELAERKKSSPYPNAQTSRMIGPRVDRKTLEGKFFSNPEGAAQALVDTKALKDRVATDPRMKRLNALVVEYKQAAKSEGGQKYLAGLQPPIGEEDLAGSVGHLEKLSERKATLQRMLPDAASTAHADELRKQIKDIETAEGAGAQHLTKLQTTQKFQGAPQPEAQATGSMDASPEFQQGLNEAFRSAGIGHRDIAGAINDGMRDLAKSFDGKLDMDGPVNFRYALPYVIQAMGPEAQVEWSQFAAKIQAERQAERQRQQPQESGIENPSGTPGEAPTSELQQTRDDIKINMETRKAAMMDLANATELQSWPAIISFVLLSMLIGPNGAFMFFSNARKKRELQGWIQSLDIERKDLKDLENDQVRQKEQVRREAVERLSKDRDYTRSRDDSIHRLYLNHKLVMERAKKQADPTFRIHVSKLEQDYNRVLKRMESAEKIMNNDWLDDRDPKKIKASRDYAELEDVALGIDKELLKMTNKIAPGTYSFGEEAPE